MKFNYTAYKEESLREFLLSFYLSKSRIYTLFCEKNILVNDRFENENYLLHANDKITIIEEEKIDFIPLNKKLDILYEDDNFLIINKPSGILIHPDEKTKTDSLCNMVAAYYKEKGYDITVKYAHRLDFDTTGLVIFVKDMLTHAYMNEKISIHEVQRVYLALAMGKFKIKEGIINEPIAKDRHNAKRRRVGKTGEAAITHYEVLHFQKTFSLVKCILETGRTHQIRVHLSYLNHPLLGDTLYGGEDALIKRCALHSYMVCFIHPVTKKEITVKAPLAGDMASFVDKEMLKKL